MLNSSDRQLLRIGAIAAVLGPLVLFVSTVMHPLFEGSIERVAEGDGLSHRLFR